MAIDSLRKRASIASLGLAFLGPSVVPDSSLAVGDRQTIANSYYGIDSSTSGIDVGGTSQLESLTATGGVTLEINLGATSQLNPLSATGGVTLEINLGGTSQLAAFTASGGVQVGEVVVSAHAPSGNNRAISATNRTRTFSNSNRTRRIN